MESLIRNCAYCEKQFHLESLKSWKKAYCDVSCRNSAKSARQNVKRRGELLETQCKGCNLLFLPRNTNHTFCTRKCLQKSKERKRKRRHQVAAQTRTCLHCSGPIESDRNRNCIYCLQCAKPESRRLVYCQDCGVRLPPRKRTFCPDCLEKTKYARNRAAQYNISLTEYRVLVARGKCDICHVTLKERMPDWSRYSEVGHIDHCHKTGKVRGYLCRNCNHMIGNALDDASRLQSAIDYLTISD